MAPRTTMRRKPEAPARIADVARLAGVSSATVSRTLANPEVVAEATRLKVMSAVASTGYTPNIAARNLRARRAMMALVVVPDIGNPFFSEVLRGIDETLMGAGYGLIIANLDNSPGKETRYANLARAGQVDGVLLLCGRQLRGADGQPLDAHLPTVAACETIPGAAFAQVEVNNREAARRAVAHLTGLGHRRIAYVAGPAANVLEHARREGCREALAEAGAILEPALTVQGDFTFASGVAAAQTLLARPAALRPTAVFAANDEMAIGVMKTARAHGLAIPDDLSVAGFDGIDSVDYCEPTLTTIIQPRRRIGSLAASMLLEAMGPGPYQPRRSVLTCALRTGGSTGALKSAARPAQTS